MKILLTTLNAKYIHLNLAIRLLYDLNKNNEGLQWKEFTIKEPKDEIADYCKAFDVVCFSCYIWNITQTLEVAKKIKVLNPATKILLGGPEVSYDWQDVIALNEVDFIITGEGEIPFRQFLESYPNIATVPNLVSKNNGEVLYHKKELQIDLNLYANTNPYTNEPAKDLYNKVLYIETSRGCPYKCEFCLASLDNSVRYLPIDHIKNNLLYLMQHGRVIKFLDRTFNIKKDFTIEMFQFILDHHSPENVFQFEITADIVHPDIIDFIQKNVPKGLLRFEIGIQTVNQKANLEVSRKQNFEKTKSIIKQLENKIELHLDLIVGLPLDYFEDVKYSFEEVFKLFAPELQLGFLKFLKGTPVRYKYAEHNFVFDAKPPYQIIESKYLSKKQLLQITELEHALEIYWNKKRCLNTLKYVTAQYSIFDFLCGLGKYFGEVKDYHKFTLQDIYNIIFQFAQKNYADDKVLQQLIALDYFMHHTVRPKVLFVEELNRLKQLDLIAKHNLNQHKFRHVFFEIDFDVELFLKENRIENKKENMILQFSGVAKPEIIFHKNNFNLQLQQLN